MRRVGVVLKLYPGETYVLTYCFLKDRESPTCRPPSPKLISVCGPEMICWHVLSWNGKTGLCAAEILPPALQAPGSETYLKYVGQARKEVAPSAGSCEKLILIVPDNLEFTPTKIFSLMQNFYKEFYLNEDHNILLLLKLSQRESDPTFWTYLKLLNCIPLLWTPVNIYPSIHPSSSSLSGSLSQLLLTRGACTY